VNRGFLYYAMIPLLLLMCVLQSTAAARLQVGAVKPDLVLLLVIVGTLLYGARPGLLWAFIAGLGLDLFSGGPLGASSLALMAAAAVVSLGHRPFFRYNLLVPVAAAVLGTLTYAAVYLLILVVLNTAGWFIRPLPWLETVRSIVLPATLYNTVLMVLLLPFLNRMPESQDI
jgi:rod shape-determining protein MreD